MARMPVPRAATEGIRQRAWRRSTKLRAWRSTYRSKRAKLIINVETGPTVWISVCGGLPRYQGKYLEWGTWPQNTNVKETSLGAASKTIEAPVLYRVNSAAVQVSVQIQ